MLPVPLNLSVVIPYVAVLLDSNILLVTVPLYVRAIPEVDAFSLTLDDVICVVMYKSSSDCSVDNAVNSAGWHETVIVLSSSSLY